MDRVFAALGFLGVLLGLGWYVSVTYMGSPAVELEVQGGTATWLPGITLLPEERYFYLKKTQPLTADQRRSLRAKYSISFIEELLGFGYVIKRPLGMGARQLTLLNDEDDLAVHRITAANRLSSALPPSGRSFSVAGLRDLGSLDDTTIALLVTFRQDVAVAAQRDLLGSLTATGTSVQHTGPDDHPVWRVQMTPTQLHALAAEQSVRWIEPVGPRPRTDLGEAVPGVGGGGLSEAGSDEVIGQVEPCAALRIHAGFTPDRMIPDAEPEPLCVPVLAELSGFVDTLGFDKAVFNPQWPLWLDTDGDRRGDICVWDGTNSPCSATLVTPAADAVWEWIKLDSIDSPHLPRYVHIESQKKGTVDHFRLCSNLPQETLPGCSQPPGTGMGFWPQSIPADDPFIGKDLKAFSPVAHATHVAGIMIGDGTDTETTYTPTSVGMAPQAQVRGFAMGMEDATQALVAYNKLKLHDIKVVNNSWGLFHGFSPVPANFWLAHYYDSYSSGRRSDGAANNWNRRVLIVGSAGNKGQYSGNSSERWQSARLGNSSKNSIAVANLRKDLELAADSSRGPTKDGRITPLISTIGGDNSVEDASDVRSSFPYGYGRLWGTSQAAPLVAATAALVAKVQTNTCVISFGFAGGTQPGEMNPALVRGILIHTAKKISATDPEGPDFRTGFGILDAFNALQFAEGTKFQSHRIRTGYVEYAVAVNSAELESNDLRVTLTWDDPPWPVMLLPSQQQGLLHTDLDLELFGPDGRRYLPWVLDSDQPANPAKKHDLRIFKPVPLAYRDHRNTIEQVVVDNAQTGVWRIRVRSNHPFGTDVAAQPFTLVSGAFGDGTCAALTPRVVENVIWLPSDPFRWCVFWVALSVILLLLLVAWFELRNPPPPIQGGVLEVPPFRVTLLRFTLFVLMLILIFLALYHWSFGLSFWGLGLALLIGIYLYLTTP